MMLSREPIALIAVCALAGLVSLAVAFYVLIGGNIAEQGLDGLFLLIVCATFAAAFGLILAKTLSKGRLKELLSSGQSKTSTAAADLKAGASASRGDEGELAGHSPKTAGKS